MNAPTPVPAADPAGVMGLFDNSHQQIAAMLQRLTQLANDLAEQGTTLPLRTEARAVRDWLGREAREHHLDEERHIFPPLLASGDEELMHVTRLLQQDHGWLEENWLSIQPELPAAVEGFTSFNAASLQETSRLFCQLYADHMLLEESVAYPAFSPLVQGQATAEAMRQEIEQRRSVRAQLKG